MAVTGWKESGAQQQRNRTSASGNWGTPANASGSDNNYAQGAANKEMFGHWLEQDTYGFTSTDIPSGSTIDGIEMEIERYVNVANTINDDALYLRKTSGQVGSNKASATAWPTTEGTATYGGSSDLWGTTWSQSDITSADFGCDLSVYNADAGASRIGYVDNVRIRVYYTEAAAGTWPGWYQSRGGWF